MLPVSEPVLESALESDGASEVPSGVPADIATMETGDKAGWSPNEQVLEQHRVAYGT